MHSLIWYLNVDVLCTLERRSHLLSKCNEIRIYVGFILIQHHHRILEQLHPTPSGHPPGGVHGIGLFWDISTTSDKVWGVWKGKPMWLTSWCRQQVLRPHVVFAHQNFPLFLTMVVPKRWFCKVLQRIPKSWAAIMYFVPAWTTSKPTSSLGRCPP